MCTRLSRNLAFIAALMDSGVEFIAVDNPHANKLTIHILAAVAQHEREAISERTKAALAAAKARGVKLGKPRLAEARADVIEARIAAADAFAANHRANPEQRRHEPPWTRQGLSARGVKTARGGEWTDQVGVSTSKSRCLRICWQLSRSHHEALKRGGRLCAYGVTSGCTVDAGSALASCGRLAAA
jgi:hypothetical protein